MRSLDVIAYQNKLASKGIKATFVDAKSMLYAKRHINEQGCRSPQNAEDAAYLTPSQRDAFGSFLRIGLRYVQDHSMIRHFKQTLQFLKEADSKQTPAGQRAIEPFRSWVPGTPRGVFSMVEWRKMATLNRIG